MTKSKSQKRRQKEKKNKFLGQSRFEDQLRRAMNAAGACGLFVLLVPHASAEKWLIYDAKESGKVLMTYFPDKRKWLMGAAGGTVERAGQAIDLARREVIRRKEEDEARLRA